MPVVIVSLAWRDLRSSGGSLMVFCACLALGVALISASGGLFRLVSSGLVADTRALFGGDLEIEHRVPLSAEELAWMRARGEVSRLVEVRTMMRTGGRAHLVELQSFDDRYPLYGVVVLIVIEALILVSIVRVVERWVAPWARDVVLRE